MARKLILALAILAVVAVPVPALAGGHRSHGGPFVSVDIFAAPYPYSPGPAYPPYPYAYPYPSYAYAAPACYWQPGYSVNQPLCGRLGPLHLRAAVGTRPVRVLLKQTRRRSKAGVPRGRAGEGAEAEPRRSRGAWLRAAPSGADGRARPRR